MPSSKLLTRNDLQNVLAHINLGDDAHKEITQAEFDALTDEEKDDGTIYFITDGISKNIFLDDNTPVGAIMPYGGGSDPAYWLICDGRAVSRTAYAELFAVIGTTYGIGDGSTTFNIPDLRGRVAIGSGLGSASDAVERNIGQMGGNEKVTLTTAQLPSHKHAIVKWQIGTQTDAGGAQWFQTNVTSGSNWNAISGAGGNATFDAGTSATGGNTGHDNMQPYLVTNYIIKTASAAQKEQTNIDLFYPVGARFETSDSTFNPSVRWGGVWTLLSNTQYKWERIS